MHPTPTHESTGPPIVGDFPKPDDPPRTNP